MSSSHSNDINAIICAASFAAQKHRDQRRKDCHMTPYINHPLGVAELISTIGGIHDPIILQASLLHDTIEDTETSYEIILQTFGKNVADIVLEVTDDKLLPKDERKRAQIQKSLNISREAKIIKLADKLHNLQDILKFSPTGWSVKRVQGYFIWSKMVVDAIRGTNFALESALDSIFSSHFTIDEQFYKCLPDEPIDVEFIFPTM